MKKFKLLELRTGKVKILPNSNAKSTNAKSINVKSAIAKSVTSEHLSIGILGLAGDEQADRVHHGGEEKAIHHYALENYDYWHQYFPEKKHLFKAGGFGENFSTLGMTEHNVCIGDIYRAGSAVLQVSQARQPCWKLNLVFQQDGMARQVQDSLRTGWYYRVLEKGHIAQGDDLQLLERPEPQWPLSRLLSVFFLTPLDQELLKEITQLSSLTTGWKILAENRLKSHNVEDWSYRVNGLLSS